MARESKNCGKSPPGIAPGEVIYTMGWPLTSKEYGGAWIYGGKDNVVSLGFVTGLDYPDPRLDPQHVLQDFKQHPFVAKLARRRKDDPLRREVASLWRLVGASAAGGRWLDDYRRLRRISKFAAAERNSSCDQERNACRRNRLRCAEIVRFLRVELGDFQTRVEKSWIKDELWKVRNFHQGFEHGFWRGMFNAGLQQFTRRAGVARSLPVDSRIRSV